MIANQLKIRWKSIKSPLFIIQKSVKSPLFINTLGRLGWGTIGVGYFIFQIWGKI